MSNHSNNVGASTCVVCRGPCSRYRLTCRGCYEAGHRPLEGKTDAEVAELLRINDVPHDPQIRAKSRRRNPPRLPHERDSLDAILENIGDEWKLAIEEPDRNRAYNLKIKVERRGYESTQRRENGTYKIYARKIQGAA